MNNVNKKKHKLLIVEDDYLHQKIYNKIFSPDFEVMLCKNDYEFNEAINKSLFEICIIDLALINSEDGIKLIKKLREKEEYKNTPIIVVTSYALKRDERVSLEAGATAFLTKPINIEILLEEVNKYIN